MDSLIEMYNNILSIGGILFLFGSILLKILKFNQF